MTRFIKARFKLGQDQTCWSTPPFNFVCITRRQLLMVLENRPWELGVVQTHFGNVPSFSRASSLPPSQMPADVPSVDTEGGNQGPSALGSV